MIFHTTSRPALRAAACGGRPHCRGGRATGDRTGVLVEVDRTDTLFTTPSTGAPRTM
jgi:hypothetical protein